MSAPTVIVLAGQRAGVVNPLAERAGVSHKCLVPVGGKPLILHVIDVLARLSPRPEVLVSVEPEAHGELAVLLADYVQDGLPIAFVASARNLAQSVLIAAQGCPGPIVVTTADNVLLTAASIERVLAELKQSQAVACMASEAAVKAVHPEAQRNFYKFRDGGYANCNLYGLAGPAALGAIQVFREGGQFQKNPKRLITAFGPINMLLVRMGWVTLQGAMKLASRRFGLTFRALVFGDGSAAVDVDNERTYAIAEMVLNRRTSAG
ncbi:MAG TPA: NTP transferase domain-containing protein [Novosphingobium sp.]|nr:NTP transferase domain-containing protein [Novosphingobium sp.]